MASYRYCARRFCSELDAYRSGSRVDHRMRERIHGSGRRCTMSRISFFFLAVTSLACTSTTSSSNVPTDTTTVTWKQVWSDEFDGAAGTAPDPSKWNYDSGDGCSSGICGW